jgi:Icc-related predicted phosphoesterase
MKFYFCDDLHLEFGDIKLENKDNVDLLILGGDIIVANDLISKDRSSFRKRYLNFFDQINDEFPETIMIAGNHESYHGDLQNTHQIIRDALAPFDRIRFLEKDSIETKTHLICCTTLWSDMNKGNPGIFNFIRYAMNDFVIVNNGGVKFTPEDAYQEHQKSLQWLQSEVISTDKDVIVVTHHAPSFQSVHPKYQTNTQDQMMNYGYCSDLEPFIQANPNIKFWCHGHVHNIWDYMVGQCRVICNPRGYMNREQVANNFRLKLIEV